MKYKDIVKEIKRKLAPLELEYYSYEKFEKRQQSSKSIELSLKYFIQSYRDKVAQIQNIALQSQMIMIWNDLDMLINQLQDMRIAADQTNYQGSTFFESSKKDEESFKLLSETELTILDLMNELEIRLVNYKDAVDSALLGNSSNIIGDIRKLLAEIMTLYKLRQDAIKSFRFIN